MRLACLVFSFATLVARAQISITTPSLPDGAVNVQYSLTMSSSGAVPPSIWSATGLPPGLTISTPGTISGFPTTTGVYTVVVSLKDVQSHTTSRQYPLTIFPTPVITTPVQLPDATVGFLYSVQMQSTPAGSWSLAGIGARPPPGLTLTSAGLLSGIPTDPGLYAISIDVVTPLTTLNRTFRLTILDNTPSVQASPTSLTFNAIAGGEAPPPQSLSILQAPNAASANFRVLVDNGQANTAPSFSLTVKPPNGTAPAQLTVSADQGNLAGGIQAARIRIIDTQGFEADVPVTLNVNAAAPQLQVTPATVHFTASLQRPGIFAQDLAISNGGGGGPLGFSIAVLGNSSWIVGGAPSSGQTVRGSPVFVRLLIDTTGLQQSVNDVLRISFAGSHVDVPVFVFLANDGPAIASNVSGVLFEAQQGGVYSLPKTVQILNTDTTGSSVNWTAQMLSGEDLVAFANASGTATFGSPSTLKLTLKQSATQLAIGTHYELISVSDPNAQNSPLLIEIVLDLNPANAAPVLDLNPPGIFIPAVAGGQKTAAQTITVNTSSAPALPFQVATSTDDGDSWLIASTASGRASGQVPGSFTLSVDPSRLAAGIHSAQASVSMSGVVQSVNVTVVVLPAGSVIAAPESELVSHNSIRPAAVGCAPSKIALTASGLVNNFSVPAKWPAALIVQLNDDCGGTVLGGSVVASFSNGDAPLTLRAASQGGTYSATWQPGAVSAQMVVTLNATAGTLQPAIVKLIGGVASNQNQVPVLKSGGIVNAYYPVPEGMLSPGTVVQMFGAGLASEESSTGSPPLPFTFNGTTVLVGGYQAPLFYLKDGELDVQIPAELVPNQRYFVIVSSNGALSQPQQLEVVPLQPAAQAYADGQCGAGFLAQECYIHLAAVHGIDGTTVTVDNPAMPGETVIAYLLGMGATDPGVPSGTAAPSDPQAQATVQPLFTVNGESAQILYAGLSANAVGLYEIDFIIPMDATPGDLPVVITQNGVPANTTLLTVGQPAPPQESDRPRR